MTTISNDSGQAVLLGLSGSGSGGLLDGTTPAQTT